MESAFGHRNACRRFAELWRVRVDLRKACTRLAELWSVFRPPQSV